MNAREEVKMLILAMSDEQLEWFISQMQKELKDDHRKQQPGSDSAGD